MKLPHRFNATPVPGIEGRLTALGRDETPDPEAKRRVAHRLGISASTLASVIGTAAIAINSKAAAVASSAKVAGAWGAAIGETAGSFFAATLAKATVVGLGLGIVSYVGVKAYTAGSSSQASPVTAPKAMTSREPERAVGTVGIPTEASMWKEPEVKTDRTRASAPWRGNSEATTPVKPIDATNVPQSRALAIGRFEDNEPPVTPQSSAPTVAISSTASGLPENYPATPRASAPPVDPRLAREVASLDLARASASRGDAAGALRELTRFERSYGYLTLRREALLVNIDVLLSLGRRAEAAAIARHLLRLGPPATERARLEELVRAHH